MVDLQIQLIRQLRKLAKQQARSVASSTGQRVDGEARGGGDSEGKEKESDGEGEGSLTESVWFFEYCRVLVKQLVDLIEPLKALQKDGKMMKEYL